MWEAIKWWQGVQKNWGQPLIINSRYSLKWVVVAGELKGQEWECLDNYHWNHLKHLVKIQIPEIIYDRLACFIAKSGLTLCNPMDCSCQAPLSVGFPRQEFWRGLPLPSPGDLLRSGIETTSLVSPALAGKFFTTTPLRPAESQSMMLKLTHSQLF